MKPALKILILAALAVAVIAAVALKKGSSPATPGSVPPPPAMPVTAPSATSNSPAVAVKLPKLLDLGAGKCIPCKMMKPILDDLKASYANRFTTEFIDVWQNPDAGKQYGIEVIPTQIFYDDEGKELFRHVGFFSKEDILAKWKELGVAISAVPPTAP
jgi:thioredoxin 1